MRALTRQAPSISLSDLTDARHLARSVSLHRLQQGDTLSAIPRQVVSMPEPEPPQYLTINESARLLGVSRATMYRLLADEGFRASVVVAKVTPRGKMRIERASLLRWAESRR